MPSKAGAVAKPGRENWVDDATVSTCKGCDSVFSLFTRRHHCRACGHVFCKPCSSFEIGLHREHYGDGVEKQKKVCAWCFKALAGQRQNLVRTALATPAVAREEADFGQVPSIYSEEDSGMLGQTSFMAPTISEASSFDGSRSPSPAPSPRPSSGALPPQPTLLAPSSRSALAPPVKASSFQDSGKPHLVAQLHVPDVPGSGLPASEPGAPTVLQASPRAASAPSKERPLSSRGMLSREEETGCTPGDMSEFAGPRWQAFRDAQPAAAASFRRCAQALADPKIWENEAELTIKTLRQTTSRVPREELRDAPGLTQVLLFLDRLEAKRPLYRRHTAQLREAIMGGF